MKLIDVTVPLDSALPTDPNNTPIILDAITRIARGDRSNLRR
jgi:kynurenine formamidase